MEHTLMISRPPAEVFSYLTDVEKLPEWQSSAVEVRAEGPLQVGTRIKETRTFLGRHAESTLEVTEYDPDRKFSLRVVTGPLPYEVRHTLNPADGGTRLDWVGEAEASRFPRFAVRMVARTAEGQFKADLERLKRLLEARGR